MFLHLLAILARRLGVDGPEDEAEARSPPELRAHLLTQRDQLVTGHLWRKTLGGIKSRARYKTNLDIVPLVDGGVDVAPDVDRELVHVELLLVSVGVLAHLPHLPTNQGSVFWTNSGPITAQY